MYASYCLYIPANRVKAPWNGHYKQIYLFIGIDCIGFIKKMFWYFRNQVEKYAVTFVPILITFCHDILLDKLEIALYISVRSVVFGVVLIV